MTKYYLIGKLSKDYIVVMINKLIIIDTNFVIYNVNRLALMFQVVIKKTD